MLPDNYKILLAEDNPINQRVAVLSLKRLGLKCDIANNGAEAFEMHKKNRYNIIFMDVQMPMVDGVRATEQIREFEKGTNGRPPSFIIAMTANSFSNDKEECFEAGMDEFLNKPFDEVSLRSVLEKAISK